MKRSHRLGHMPPGSGTYITYSEWYGTISWRRRAFDAGISCCYDRVVALEARLSASWLTLVAVAIGVLLLGAFIDPLLFALGLMALAGDIFGAYHLICAQIPSHSYDILGYQLALCARNLAIYSTLFVGTIAYHRLRAWLPPLDWRLWLLTMGPMAWDGGTQLLGWRESNWELRTLTGIIFGLGVCWFLLPQIERAARNTSLPLASRRNGTDGSLAGVPI